MKNDSSINKSDAISGALREWRVEIETPPGFRSEVRRRIRSAAAGRSSAGWFERFGETFARPLVALPTLLACIALALTLAHLHVQSAERDTMDNLERLYTASIDPLDPNHLDAH